MLVRLAHKTEQKALADLWLRSSISSHSFIPKSFWEKRVKIIELSYIAKSLTFVCEEQGKILGFLSFVKPGFIGGLFVDDTEQQKGVGSSLMHQAKHLFPSLELEVYAKNKGALEFYKKQGFTLEFSHMGDETGEECMRMRWHK